MSDISILISIGLAVVIPAITILAIGFWLVGLMFPKEDDNLNWDSWKDAND